MNPHIVFLYVGYLTMLFTHFWVHASIVQEMTGHIDPQSLRSCAGIPTPNCTGRLRSRLGFARGRKLPPVVIGYLWLVVASVFLLGCLVPKRAAGYNLAAAPVNGLDGLLASHLRFLRTTGQPANRSVDWRKRED